MSMSEEVSDLLPGAPLSRAPQLVRRLTWMYGGYALAIGLMMIYGAVPFVGLPKLKGMSVELLVGSLGVVSLTTVLLTLISLLATSVLAFERLSRRRAEADRLAGMMPSGPPSLFTHVWRLGPGVLAREGQAVILLLGALAITLLAWKLWPSMKPPAPAAGDANLIAALLIGLAFPSLIAERMMHAFPSAQMPEAIGVRRILLLTTLTLAASGVAEVGRSIGFEWVFWVQRALLTVTVIITLEFALRSLARMFLPRPTPETAKAVTDSIAAALITGGPKAPGALIRTHLGLDFTRSWALQFLVKAMGPALVGTLLLCWILSGVKLLGGDQRGVYERFGAPVAVFKPGLHVMLPWPLGRMRAVEYGTTHTIAVGARLGPDAYEQTEKNERIGAEATPPAGMNRLWETAHATEAEFLVASRNEGGQGFQAVNGEILVIYRTGLSDKSAMQSVYGSADPAMVVEQEADRLATRYFASHTLDEVIGGQRDQLQESLRAQLAKAVDADGAGVDIVAVLIDAIHPPVGAAAAYHAVQAAQINAEASIAQATAHATRTLGQADQESHKSTTAAEAAAIEKVQAAGGDAYQFDADRQAYRASPQAFLLERRSRNLTPGLKGVRLTVLDHRLNANQAPIMDLREASPMVAAAASPAPAAKPTYAPEQPPATSTEGPAPPSTSEDAAEQARARTTRKAAQ
jgi:regulator of protease activity HflC (stomatin/prohibitin superfamily)